MNDYPRRHFIQKCSLFTVALCTVPSTFASSKNNVVMGNQVDLASGLVPQVLITGTVYDKETLLPQANCLIDVFPRKGFKWFSKNRGTVVTDVNGFYAITLDAPPQGPKMKHIDLDLVHEDGRATSTRLYLFSQGVNIDGNHYAANHRLGEACLPRFLGKDQIEFNTTI